MKFKPRIYQQQAIDAAIDYILQAPPGFNPLIALPTGTGKSIVIAHIICELLARYPNVKFLKMTHVKELVEQKKLHAGSIIKDVARNIQGGGGGQPFFATAGGKNPAGLQDAINQARNIVEEIE